MLRNSSKFKFVKYALLASVVVASNTAFLSSVTNAVITIVPGGGVGKVGSNVKVITKVSMKPSSDLLRSARKNYDRLAKLTYGLLDLDDGYKSLQGRLEGLRGRLDALRAQRTSGTGVQ